VDPAFRPEGWGAYQTFHPTFLYELLWNLAGAALIVYLDKRYDLRGGRVFWLYVMVYTAGRLWIEMVRIDDAHYFWGIRLNVFVSVVALVASTIIFFWLGARQRRLPVHVPRHELAAVPATGGEPSEPDDGGDPPEADADSSTAQSTDA